MSYYQQINYDLVTILGPTATGKTRLAVYLADQLKGEIISADSRQVYRGMDIGTGKDLKEYQLNEKNIPFHLIDISDPKEEYNVFQYQKDFQTAITYIRNQQNLPILCGGTGFYVKTILMDFHLPSVKPNKKLRQKLENWELDDLIQELESISPGASNYNLIDTKRRIIRAIELEMSNQKGNSIKKIKSQNSQFKIQNPIVIGIEFERDVIRERITERLHQRLNQGMIKEVELLLENGITHERLESLGLEYRFISHYLQNQFTLNEMTEKLNTAIHQFAKRQMTFFRNMEKNGIKIHWIPEGNFKKSLEVILKG